MGFIRITHKDPDIGDAVTHESALPLWEESGWTAVDPADVRDLPSAFESDIAGPSDPDAPLPPAQPARSASKADWVTYAVDLGVDRDTAEAMTRDELVTNYALKES